MRRLKSRFLACLLALAMVCSAFGNMNITHAKAATYPGDYQEGYSISAAELAIFEGDITITVEYELLSGYEYSQIAFFSKMVRW